MCVSVCGCGLGCVSVCGCLFVGVGVGASVWVCLIKGQVRLLYMARVVG